MALIAGAIALSKGFFIGAASIFCIERLIRFDWVITWGATAVLILTGIIIQQFLENKHCLCTNLQFSFIAIDNDIVTI
jgi:hypothetical protein